jgi:small subunit ribosomal protein S9
MTTKMEEPKIEEEKKPKKAPAKKAAPKAKKVEEVEVEVAEKDNEEMAESRAAKGGSFIPAVGRRKRAVARVRLIKNGKGDLTVNGKPMKNYFTTFELREQIESPLKVTGQEAAVDMSAKVEGGGIRGQAEAIRHGLSRALVQLNPTFRKTLKKLGYLTRDSRKRERKKFGKKSARRSPQWSKR